MSIFFRFYSSGMGPGMRPMMHTPGPGGMQMEPGLKPEELQYRDWLQHRDIDITNHLTKMEKDLAAAKKRKKQLINKQKTVCNVTTTTMGKGNLKLVIKPI